MVDREKVIGDIERCVYRLPDGCSDCSHYRDDEEDIVGCMDELLSDALALLKEQEAVEPSFKQDEDGIFVWCCGSCGAYMYHIYEGIDKAKEYAKFCRQCGKPVKWE